MRLSALYVLIAVTARAQPIAPVVNPPRAHSGVIVSVGEFLSGGTNAYQAFKRGIDAARQRNADRLVIPPGRYVFDDPEIAGAGAHIGIYNLNDVVVDGQGAELVFHNPNVQGIALNGEQRILLRNFSIDWDVNLTSSGVVKKEAGRTTIRIDDRYPADGSTPFSAVSEFDVANRKWKKTNNETYSPRNVQMVAPQTFTSPDFDRFADRSEVIVRHYVYGANAISGYSPLLSDVSIEDVTVYSAPGMGFFFGVVGSGIRLTRCTIIPKPNGDRLISTTADGAHFTACAGNVIVENCDFSGQGDDSLNIHASWLDVTSQPDASTIQLVFAQSGVFFSNALRAGSTLTFRSRADLSEKTSRKATDVALDASGGRYTVHLDQPLDSSVVLHDLVAATDLFNSVYLIRNNFFHDHRARGMLIQSPNGLIENNRVKDTTMAGMHVTADSRTFFEGPGAENVTIRGNSFEGTNYGGELYSTGRHMGAISIVADVPSGISSYPVHRNLTLEDNQVIDTPGLALLIASVDHATVRGLSITDSNALPTGNTGSGIDAQAKGSVMVTCASNVTISSLSQTASRTTYANGIYVDSRNTSNIAVINGRIRVARH